MVSWIAWRLIMDSLWSRRLWADIWCMRSQTGSGVLASGMAAEHKHLVIFSQGHDAWLDCVGRKKQNKKDWASFRFSGSSKILKGPRPATIPVNGEYQKQSRLQVHLSAEHMRARSRLVPSIIGNLLQLAYCMTEDQQEHYSSTNNLSRELWQQKKHVSQAGRDEDVIVITETIYKSFGLCNIRQQLFWASLQSPTTPLDKNVTVPLDKNVIFCQILFNSHVKSNPVTKTCKRYHSWAFKCVTKEFSGVQKLWNSHLFCTSVILPSDNTKIWPKQTPVNLWKSELIWSFVRKSLWAWCCKMHSSAFYVFGTRLVSRDGAKLGVLLAFSIRDTAICSV